MRYTLPLIAFLLAGCDEGTEALPKPRLVCTQVTGIYACGRGGTCEQCGTWEVGCPKPLELREEKDPVKLVCRMRPQ